MAVVLGRVEACIYLVCIMNLCTYVYVGYLRQGWVAVKYGTGVAPSARLHMLCLVFFFF